MLRKLPIISNNASNKSCWKLNFLEKTQWAHMSMSPRSGTRGSTDWHVSNIIMYWNVKIDSFSSLLLAKLPIISKNVWNKSCWKLNFLRKTQWAHTSIFPRSGARGSTDCHVSNIIMYRNKKVVSLEGSMLPKLSPVSKNASSKSC